MSTLAAGVTIAVAVLAALSSLLSARSSHRTQRELQALTADAQSRLAEAQAEVQRSLQRANEEAARALDLEARLAERKYEAYSPMIKALSALLTPAAAVGPSTSPDPIMWSEFGTWIAIFGSDEALRAWRNLQQATYFDPPPLIFIRLFAEFLRAARRDMGDQGTSASLTDLVGARFKDLYTSAETRAAIEDPWPKVEEKFDWKRPWAL